MQNTDESPPTDFNSGDWPRLTTTLEGALGICSVPICDCDVIESKAIFFYKSINRVLRPVAGKLQVIQGKYTPPGRRVICQEIGLG